VVFNNVLYFAADDGDHFELYRTPFQVPVELASFDGAPIDGSAVQLEWRTASEQNNAGFRVERSRGSGPWQEVGFVDSKSESGTPSEPRTYRLTDEDLPYGADTLEYRLRQVDVDGSATVVAERAVEVGGPERFALHGSFPNPFQERTTIRYELPEEREVTIAVHDARGRKVRTLLRGEAQRGRQETTFAAEALASGVYFVRMQAGDYRETRKLVLVR
jgi:hypothetical protein